MKMAIKPREILNKKDENGIPSGKSGTVYDVNIKYRTPDGERKSHAKRGFRTIKEAKDYEATKRLEFQNPVYASVTFIKGNQTLEDYLFDWIKIHQVNLRPNTLSGYKCNINNHIIPHIGDTKLKNLSGEILDSLYSQLSANGLSQSSVRYVHRTLSVALEAARKYKYITHNPTHDILTKFKIGDKEFISYNVEQIRHLVKNIIGTELEFPIIFGVLYGKRISEILGLRWQNVDLSKMQVAIVEQLPKLPPGIKIISEMLPPEFDKEMPLPKGHKHVIPITDVTLPFFRARLELCKRLKSLSNAENGEYYDNNLVYSKPDGSPYTRSSVSKAFNRLLERANLPRIRFHDLRRTAATNLHLFSGDTLTVGMVLGHSLKGISTLLDKPMNSDIATPIYINATYETMKAALDKYHTAVLAPEKADENS
jgi:integrase